VREDRSEGAGIDARQAISALIRVNPDHVIDFAYGSFGADLDALLALGAQADPVPARGWKLPPYSDRRLLGIVLFEVAERANQLTGLTAGASAFVSPD
jgi:hypothetical protein